MRVLLVAALMALCLPVESLATTGDGVWRHKSLVGARYNRLGLSWFSDTAYRVPLSKKRTLLLKNTYVEVGGAVKASPASFHPGVYAEVVPIAPIRLRATVMQLRYFGTYTALFEFEEGHDADYSDDELDRIEDGGLARHETGLEVQGIAQLRLKFGKLLALYESRLSYLKINDMKAGDTWYETTYDVLMEKEDGIHIMYATLGYLLWGNTDRDMLIIGSRYQRDSTFETDIQRQILSGVLIYRPSKSAWFLGAKPTFGFLGGGYLEDVYREGEPIFHAFMVLEWARL
jgi:hypothetical protein